MADYKEGDLLKLFGASSTTNSGLFSRKSETKKRQRNSETAKVDDQDEKNAILAGLAQESAKKKKVEEEVGKQKEIDQEAEEEKNRRTVFVGNVPLSAAPKLEKLKKVLKNVFKQFGEIDSIRLRSVPIAKAKISSGGDHKLMRKVATYQNKLVEAAQSCNAYVVFKEFESVEKAIAVANGMLVGGFHIRVDKLTADKKNGKGASDKNLFDRRRTVFVGNVPFEASEETVREFIESNSEATVDNVRIVRDNFTNSGKGFAYVLLGNHEMIEAALKANGQKIGKREIRVTRCERSKSIVGNKKMKHADSENSKTPKHLGRKAAFNAERRLRKKASVGIKAKLESQKKKKRAAAKKNK